MCRNSNLHLKPFVHAKEMVLGSQQCTRMMTMDENYYENRSAGRCDDEIEGKELAPIFEAFQALSGFL